MQSLPQDNLQSADSTQKSSDGLIATVENSSNLLSSDTTKASETVESTNKSISSLSDVNKLYLSNPIVRLLLIGGLITILLLIFSNKPGNIIVNPGTANIINPGTGNLVESFLSFGGGAASLVVLTTFLGFSILPALAISSVVWFMLYSLLNLT